MVVNIDSFYKYKFKILLVVLVKVESKFLWLIISIRFKILR